MTWGRRPTSFRIDSGRTRRRRLCRKAGSSV